MHEKISNIAFRLPDAIRTNNLEAIGKYSRKILVNSYPKLLFRWTG